MTLRRFLPIFLPAALLVAQAPSGDWATITTVHYRIHYPDREGFPAFAWEVAGRIEGIHAQYLDLVGWRFEGTQDVLIGDPLQTASGFAWPLLRRPYLWLWATPPEEESLIGHHRGWEELLLAHELGHMHHMLRPQRGAAWRERFFEAVGPVARKSPRWVIEGYATALEGRITGSGRPHSVQRSAILRTWAREGRLPSYAALNGSRSFFGESMTYLAGSAYLEWLEMQAKNPKILQTLWKQLASARRRDFNASFKATFGFPAAEGYARFCAELSHDALREEAHLREAGLVEGEAFTKVEGGIITDLALSPDGSKLLARVLAPERPGLYVWDLHAPEPKAPEPSTDPEEPADVAPQVPVRQPAWVLPPLDGALARRPRWRADGRAVLFDQPLPDGEGMLRMHPRQWIPGGRVVAGTAEEAPEFPSAPRRGESEGTWNVVDAEGRPLTRTLSAMWAPTQANPQGPLFAARLTATGAEIRRFQEPPAPLQASATAPETLRTEGAVRRREDESARLPAPVRPPEPHSYRERETLAPFPVSGLHLGPWGRSIELGLGFNDFLGRLNGFVLGAAGTAAGPRGGAAALAWRGWEAPIQIHAYSWLERPSAQELRRIEGFDRERKGAEAAISLERRGRTSVRAGLRFLAEEEDRFAPMATLHRHLLEIHAEGLMRRSRGDWGLAFGLSARSTEGKTENLHWGRERGGVRLEWDTPWFDLRALAEGGFMVGRSSPADRFALGGAATSLSPASAEGFRVVQPGLPAFLATGDRYRRLRGEIHPGFGRLFIEHTALWDDPLPRPAYLRVAGWEMDTAELSLPLERIQGLAGRISLRLGLYRILDGILRHRTTASLGVALHP